MESEYISVLTFALVVVLISVACIYVPHSCGARSSTEHFFRETGSFGLAFVFGFLFGFLFAYLLTWCGMSAQVILVIVIFMVGCFSMSTLK